MFAFIHCLDEPTSLEQAGGKGANLSRLARAGFPVPPGFVITTAAYRAFVDHNNLQGRLLELCRSASPLDLLGLELASDAIRALFDRGALPDAISDAILDAYRERCPVGDGAPLAVRSSATAEDLPDASFAGQQETYLNIRGEAALLDAVRRCWSSLWTARAIAYRARQGIDPAVVSLAVVVQRLVPASAAGVMFTVNPLNGDRDEIVVNAAWGLGEAIVAGQVTPDTVVLDKPSGRVKRLDVADKTLMTVPVTNQAPGREGLSSGRSPIETGRGGEGSAGTHHVRVDPARRRQPALTAAQAAELARLGREIEAHFDGPQDVEWAVADGRLYILQARPVTALAAPGATLPPGQDDWPEMADGFRQPFDLWTQADVGERWPGPVTPLTWSSVPFTVTGNLRHSFRELSAPYLKEVRWARRQYGRVYFNEGALAHILVHEYGMPASMVSAALGGQRDSRGETEERPRWGLIVRRVPLYLRMMAARLRSERRLAKLLPTIDRAVDQFLQAERSGDVERLDDRALWAAAEGWNRRIEQVIALYADLAGTSMSALPCLEAFLARTIDRADLAQDLVKGLDGVINLEMLRDLAHLAGTFAELGLADLVLDREAATALAEVRATPAAAPALALLDRFLARYGHRCATEAEWLYPRWAEAPEQVVEALAPYLRAGDRVDPLENEARQRGRRAAAIALVEGLLDPPRGLLFRGLLARVQQVMRLHDNAQHYVVKLLLPPRRVFVALGQRWAARGWLDQPDDVFFLVLPELARVVEAGDPTAAGLDLRALVAVRRADYQRWLGVTAPDVLDADGNPVVGRPSPDGSDGVLTGIAASGGRVTGPARLIAHPREATRLQPGDILVTRSTDPGWTPLFPLVAGLVLEVGGQLSHGAIVAREYGVPAVLNVPDATRRVADGQLITVDGTTGRVYLESEAAPERSP